MAQDVLTSPSYGLKTQSLVTLRPHRPHSHRTMAEQPLNPAVALWKRGGGVEPPPEVLLSWPAPNHINPETHSWSGTIVLVVFIALTVAMFGARLTARWVVAKNAGLDDALISVAMIPLIGLTIAVVLGVRIYGFQWHSWDQTAVTYITTRQITLSIELLYMAATSLTKISILCFYRRMSSGAISRVFIYGVWGVMITVVAYFITFTFVITFTCTPVEGFWHLYDLVWRTQHELHCHDEGVIIVVIVVISTLQDFVICALPIFLVWNLQIPKRQKTALIALFGMGVITCICGVMRTYYAIYVYYFTYDITWYAYYGWIWTAVEADLGVVCACAPAMKVFFLRYFTYSSQNRSGYGYMGGKKSMGSGMRYLKKPAYGKNSSVGTTTIGSASQKDKKMESWQNQGIPLDRIQVRSDTNVVVEDLVETSSVESHSSTRILRIPPTIPQSPGEYPEQWAGSRTTCERSLGTSPVDIDIERLAKAHVR
ncbi:hypothetical protein DM02DRAFT_617820 [Periconia macrospinosa]|uniref:Rhodopsin domain-containing protein n=1 Tax=Periconia macrospinosa TaxID=97972 RepID=A0A2V1DBZ4_9PLEO|nr:hypothetical protein DM02DRAFT_617820 [Periconia macrospinosa]